MKDDWRIRIELEEEHAQGLLERLGLDLSSEAHKLAKELEGRRLVVSRDGDTIFVYAGSRDETEQARAIVESELAELRVEARLIRIEQWLEDEARWDDEPPAEDTLEEEALEHGYAPWEVRVETRSREEAARLADQLESEGYGIVRRYRYVLVGAASEQEARELAQRLHGEVEAGGELVYEAAPQNPFAIFGGLGGSGTPL
jgi:predicted mannosyl-3-phosphoglycerate phosphatase (HAD superfamily)